MACCGQSRNPSSYEYAHPFKPENNSGCSCCGKNLGCDTPSAAIEGSPLWQWEQIYGKLVTVFTDVYDENGHVQHVIERIPCPKESSKSTRTGCCSVKYRFSR